MLAFLFISLAPAINAQSAKPIWKELNFFHGFMSSSFHPAEEGNFEPLRQRADSLLMAAQIWQASPIPADFKPAETKTALAKLVNKCQAIKKAVAAKQPDNKLKTLITEVHDVFHIITGECRKADD